MIIQSFVKEVRSVMVSLISQTDQISDETHILFTNRAVGSVDNGSLAQYWRPPTTALSIYLYSSRYCEQSIKNLFGSKTKPFKSKIKRKTFTVRFTFCIPPEIDVLSSCWSFLGQSSRSVSYKVEFDEKWNLCRAKLINLREKLKNFSANSNSFLNMHQTEINKMLKHFV